MFVGTVPDWLEGSLYRVGPSQFHHGDCSYNHWFDGIAFIHKYTVKNGTVTYRSRKLEGELYKRHEQAQRIVVDGFGHLGYSDPCKNIFNRCCSLHFITAQTAGYIFACILLHTFTFAQNISI